MRFKPPAHAPDLAIIDVELSDGSGLDLVHELTSDHYQPIPIILSAACLTLPEDYDFSLTQVVATVDKPLNGLQLNHLLARKLGHNLPESGGVEQDVDIAARWLSELNLIVAEDNKVNQMVIKGQLAKLGISARVEDNGQALLDSLESQDEHFDVVLLDCEMPVLDGWSTARAVRVIEREQQSGAPLLLVGISAYALASEREKALAAGMDDYLVKPVNRDDLPALFIKYQSRIERSRELGNCWNCP